MRGIAEDASLRMESLSHFPLTVRHQVSGRSRGRGILRQQTSSSLAISSTPAMCRIASWAICF